MSGAKPKISSVAEYEKSVPELARSAWRQLRQAILTAAPEAEEMISYQMPALKQNGMVIYYLATSTHLAVSVPSPKIFMDMKKEIAPFEVGKTSIRFPLDKSLPIPLIKKIVMYRLEEEQQKAKKKG
jgi:uncharacterized protein YdhG (YjbR/CyaY superfamily)